MTLITLNTSPNDPGIETAEGLVIKRGVPYSANSVTIVINPAVNHYEEHPSENVRQLMTTRDTQDTQKIQLDINNKRRATVSFGSDKYEIELMRVEKKERGSSYHLGVDKV